MIAVKYLTQYHQTNYCILRGFIIHVLKEYRMETSWKDYLQVITMSLHSIYLFYPLVPTDYHARKLPSKIIEIEQYKKLKKLHVLNNTQACRKQATMMSIPWAMIK